jgi:hypothetical protein
MRPAFFRIDPTFEPLLEFVFVGDGDGDGFGSDFCGERDGDGDGDGSTLGDGLATAFTFALSGVVSAGRKAKSVAPKIRAKATKGTISEALVNRDLRLSGTATRGNDRT